ncbi:M43 family zinc metalloprotease [Lacinutrix algicola]|uniref:M43 family zinc metalloprotease n=1 Tax=Lacinutrix algicola TaxID=342954 RepID=UPI0006E146B7|nr:M43 family zinc metalloprotease [Lacinutrix algicola]
MKKTTIKLLLLALLCLPTITLAQSKNDTQIDRCGSDEYNAQLLEANPNMMGSDAFESLIATEIAKSKAKRTSSNSMVVVTIPVVIHVFHNGEPIGTGPNISYDQAVSQITVLNEDFRMMAGTPGQSSMGGVDTEVQFVLAQRTPDGCPTNGIDRVNICQDGLTGVGANTDQINSNLTAQMQVLKPGTIWDSSQYMNMWSVGFNNGGLLGYAQFPGGSASTDGVVSNYTTFGSSDYGTFPLNAPYDKGRTMTHEVGHYLGLFHTFQGGCNGGDSVADTPATAAPNYGCPAGTNSCPLDAGVDMIENYMDYTDDSCMDTYTQGQKDRIQAVIGGARSSLTSSNAGTPPASVAVDVEIAVESTNVACGTDLNPAVIITNWGTAGLTTATISYDIDNGTSTDYIWSGILAYGESEIIQLPSMTSSTGDHDLNVSVSAAGDARNCNDSDSNCFTLSASAGPCASVPETTDADRITGVVFNTINNINAASTSIPYEDFTAISTDIERGTDHDITVNLDTNGAFFYVVRVWIDWNQNCSFNDAGEEYDLGTINNMVNQPSTGSPLSINVPADAVLGGTTMRVGMKNTNNVDNSYDPCESGFFGQVEDYSLNILDALSVEEFRLSGISVYPNPTNNLLNIKGIDVALESVEVYSVTGQRVLTATTNLETVNVSAIAKGVYFLKLNTANATKTIKFIKE